MAIMDLIVSLGVISMVCTARADDCYDEMKLSEVDESKSLSCMEECGNVTWLYSKDCSFWRAVPTHFDKEFNKERLTLKKLTTEQGGFYKCECYTNDTVDLSSLTIKLLVFGGSKPEVRPRPNHLVIENKKEFYQFYERLVLRCDIEIDEHTETISYSYLSWMTSDFDERQAGCLDRARVLNKDKPFIEIPDFGKEPQQIEDPIGYKMKSIRNSETEASFYLTIEKMRAKDFTGYQCGVKSNEKKCSNILMITKKTTNYTIVIATVSCLLGSCLIVLLLILFWYDLVILCKSILARTSKGCIKENHFHIQYDIDEDRLQTSIDVATRCRQVFQRRGLAATLYHYDRKCYAINQDQANLLDKCYVVIILVSKQYITDFDKFKSDLQKCGLNSTRIWPKRVYILVDLSKTEFYRILVQNYSASVISSVKKDIRLFCFEGNIAEWPGQTQSCVLAFKSRRIFSWLEAQLPEQALKNKLNLPHNTNIRFQRGNIIEMNF